MDDQAPSLPAATRRVGRDTGRLRHAVRQPVRDESLREEAREGPTGERLLRRTRRTTDVFYIDRKIIPDGMEYEWKRESCYGQPDDDHQVNLRENHWKAVPADRHPELVAGAAKGGVIRKKGLVLMERPGYLSEDARREDLEIAEAQTRGARLELGHTPAGTFTRDHPSARANTRLTHVRGPMTTGE